jgi:hypothetical protein
MICTPRRVIRTPTWPTCFSHGTHHRVSQWDTNLPSSLDLGTWPFLSIYICQYTLPIKSNLIRLTFQGFATGRDADPDYSGWSAEEVLRTYGERVSTRQLGVCGLLCIFPGTPPCLSLSDGVTRKIRLIRLEIAISSQWSLKELPHVSRRDRQVRHALASTEVSFRSSGGTP